MTTVQNHIKELLFEQDCVVIPDFGGFITNFDAAKIDKAHQTIAPARKWLAFNGLLKNDDGLLSNYIAQNEGLSREEANHKIRVFVEEAKRIISFDQSYHIEEVGTFTQNQEGKIQFHPTEFSNFFGESFGLENINFPNSLVMESQLQIKSISQSTSVNTIQQVFSNNDRKKISAEVIQEYPIFKRAIPRKRNQMLRFLISMTGASLLFAFIYMYENPKISLSSFNPFQLNQTLNQNSKDILKQQKINQEILSKHQLVSPDSNLVTSTPEIVQPKINHEDERFLIIVGSFGVRENAEKQLKQLLKNGFSNARIIEPLKESNLLKVSADGFNTEEAANEASLKVSKITHQNTWIYKM